MNVGAVLLDLDGTLVDTAPDLVAVLNQMLQEHGRPPIPYAIARNEVSNGALALLRLGFGPQLSDQDLEPLRLRFLEIYTSCAYIQSRLFIDMHGFLRNRFRSELPWGIVTNKAHAMTTALLERLGIIDQPACIVSGDRLPQRKPHPAPLQLAAVELGLPVERCVYVGDAPRDIEAGRAAGMLTIAVGYGYIRPEADISRWGADLVVRRPEDLELTLTRLLSA
jgi:2-phosphoglycolate phosphatase